MSFLFDNKTKLTKQLNNEKTCVSSIGNLDNYFST